MGENSRNGLGFPTGINNPGKNKLGDHIVYTELKAHLSCQDVYDFLDIQFF